MKLLYLLIMLGLIVVPQGQQGGTSKIGGTGMAATSSTSTLNFWSGKTLGTLRNDFTGCVGLSFTAPATGTLTITELCRWRQAGNSQLHTVYLFHSSSTDTPLRSVVINTVGGPDGGQQCGAVSPIALTASNDYYIYSSETSGGDTWENFDLVLSLFTAGFGTIRGSALQTGGCLSGAHNMNSAGNKSYVPVNFRGHL